MCFATPAVFVAAASVSLAAHAGSPAPVEISDDGRTVAPPDLSSSARGYAARGSTLPFPTTPDLQVDLRRQIGGLAVADMNGDGLNDLVAVCYTSSSFPPYDDWREMIFYNSPSGLSTTPGWYSDNQSHAGDVQVGDVNGDGHNDIVVIRGGSIRTDPVQIYFGSASGPDTSPGWSATYAHRAWGTSGDLVDIDNDGDLDLVTTNQGLSPDPYRPMLMFRNTGEGLATTPAWESADEEISNGIAHADVVGADGLPDTIVAKWVNFFSGVYHNSFGTPDASPTLMVSSNGTDKGAAVADVDGDGFLEIAFGGDPTTIYQPVHGLLVPIYTSNPPFSGPQEIRLQDADGDGDPDLAEVHFSDGRAHIYQNNNGVIDTEPTWTYDATEVGTAIIFGDLNNDGRDDLIVGYSGNTCIRVFFAQAPDCPADLAEPFGVLDLADIQAFIGAFNSQEPAADLAPPFGTYDLADLQAFVSAFLAGCP